MKNSINKIAVAALALLAVACGRKEDFERVAFASFNTTNFSVDETVGTVTTKVILYNVSNSETAITLTAIDGKAVNGTDYEIVTPASGVLTFTKDAPEQDVVVAIKSHEGVFTGSMDFSIEISSATPGVTVGNLNTAYFTIKDIDHPLAMFIGTWTASAVDHYDGDVTWDFKIEADEEDATYTKLIVKDLGRYFASIGGNSASGLQIYEASVNAEKTRVTIVPQYAADGIVFTGFQTHEPTGSYANCVMELNEDGSLTIPNAFGVLGSQGWYDRVYGGATAVKN